MRANRRCRVAGYARPFVATILLLLPVGANATTIPLEIVAMTGDAATGTDDGDGEATFWQFCGQSPELGPVINRHGQIAFSARLAHDTVGVPAQPVGQSNDRGIWTTQAAGLALVAREGGLAPGLSGAVFGRQFGEPVLNDAGQVAFKTSLGTDPATLDDFAIWSGPAGAVAAVARTGVLAGNRPALFKTFNRPLLNNAGQVAFSGEFEVGVDDLPGIWSSGNLILAGDSAPQTGGEHFRTFGSPLLNDRGKIAFRAHLAHSTAVDGANDTGIWLGNASDGSLRLVARTLGPATGTNEAYATLEEPALNANGDVRFHADLTGPTPVCNQGIWQNRNGDFDALIQPCTEVAGTDANVRYSTLDSPLLSNTGRIAFSADITGPGVVTGVDDRGIWLQMARGFRMVARTGAQLPGVPDDEDVALDAVGSLDFDPVFNNRGQVAFLSHLTGTDVTPESDLAILGVDSSGELVTVARTGDPLTIAAGEVRTITDLRLATGLSGSDGKGKSLNDSGELVFWAEWTDGVDVAEGIIMGSMMITLDGDVNLDGVVDRADVDLITQWYTSYDFPDGDIDLDGLVTVYDIAILQQSYILQLQMNNPPPPPDSGSNPSDTVDGMAPVPEPAGSMSALLGTIVLGLAGCRARRRRRS